MPITTFREKLVGEIIAKLGQPTLENKDILTVRVNTKSRLQIGVRLHKLIIPNFLAFSKDPLFIKEVMTIGSFNVRKKRGFDEWSIHSWGLAIDLNESFNFGNGYGKLRLSDELVACADKYGFLSGAKWPDRMHFQIKSEVFHAIFK